MSAEPVQDLDLELHGSEGPAEPHYTATSDDVMLTITDKGKEEYKRLAQQYDCKDLQLKSGKCESCGAVVPGLISRYCINCSIKAIHYG